MCHRLGPLDRYVKLRVAHASGMPGTFSPSPWFSDPDRHHGTCVTHVQWWMPGSITSGFLWSRWRGKHSRRMRNFTHLVRGPSIDACSKTCFAGLLIRSIFRGKNARALHRVLFFSEKSNELTDQEDMFCFNHASAFCATTWKMWINKKNQGTNSNWKSYRKLPLPTFSVMCIKPVM